MGETVDCLGYPYCEGGHDRECPLSASAKALLLHRIADEQNDVRDHDEHHAAADAVILGLTTPYITRWIDGLLAHYKRGLVKT